MGDRDKKKSKGKELMCSGRLARAFNVFFHGEEEDYSPTPRQLLFKGSRRVILLMDFNSKGLPIDKPKIRGKELEKFSEKFNMFEKEELRQALRVDMKSFKIAVKQVLGCCSCFSNIVKMYRKLCFFQYDSLCPLVFSKQLVMSLNDHYFECAEALGTLFYRHNEALDAYATKLSPKKLRCPEHAPHSNCRNYFSQVWKDVWALMTVRCRNEITMIHGKELKLTVETMLKRHECLNDCNSMVLSAVAVLMGEKKDSNPKSKAFAHLKRVGPKVRISTHSLEFIESLLIKSEWLLKPAQCENHTYSMEEAKEKVMICAGIVLYERLVCSYLTSREEDSACMKLSVVGVYALKQAFETAVEKKQGFTNLEKLCEELEAADKKTKRTKKNKEKKMKKNEKAAGATKIIQTENDNVNQEASDNDEAPFEEGDTIFSNYFSLLNCSYEAKKKSIPAAKNNVFLKPISTLVQVDSDDEIPFQVITRKKKNNKAGKENNKANGKISQNTSEKRSGNAQTIETKKICKEIPPPTPAPTALTPRMTGSEITRACLALESPYLLDCQSFFETMAQASQDPDLPTQENWQAAHNLPECFF